MQIANNFNEFIDKVSEAERHDRAEMILPKGAKAKIEAVAKKQGMSRNEYILAAVKEAYKRDTVGNVQLVQHTEPRKTAALRGPFYLFSHQAAIFCLIHRM